MNSKVRPYFKYVSRFSFLYETMIVGLRNEGL